MENSSYQFKYEVEEIDSERVATTNTTMSKVPPLPCLFDVSDQVAIVQPESGYIVYTALEGTAVSNFDVAPKMCDQVVGSKSSSNQLALHTEFSSDTAEPSFH